MRILQLKTSAMHGGAEVLTLQLAQAMSKRGHSVLTILGQDGWLRGEIAKSRLPVKTLNLFGPSGILYFPALCRMMARFGPDVVLSHGARVNFYGSLAAWSLRVPSVSVEHNVDYWRQSSGVLNWIDRRIGRLNAHRIAVSSAVHGILLKKKIISPKKITLVQNAIDVKSIQERSQSRHQIRHSYGYKSNDFVVVTVARFDTQKGHSYLVDVAKRISSHHPNLKFILFGDGPLRQEIQAQVRQINLNSRFSFPGAVTGVAKLLHAFDLFVLPSLWEGYPLSVLEAMAAGLPVVATAVGGTPEIVRNEETGLLVQPGNLIELGKAIDYMIRTPSLREAMGYTGHDWIMANCDVGVMVTRYIEVLGMVVKTHRQNRGENKQ